MEVGLVLKEWEGFIHIEVKGQGLVRWGGSNDKKGIGVGEEGICCE